MNIQSIRTRQLALAAAVALAAGLATAAPAHAALPASPSASVANGTLTVLGTNGGDSIALSLAAGDPNTLLVDFGNGTVAQGFDRNTFNAIAVFLRGGDDEFHVLAGGGTFAEDVLGVDGGSGNDTIVGGDGNDILIGGSGADDIQGADGNDLIFGDAGNDTVNGNRGNDIEILGAGQDAASWNPGEGSDSIAGGSGYDSLIFNGSSGNEVMSLSANGPHAVFLRDVAAIRMDLDDVERVDVAALGGADAVTVNNLAGTDVRAVNLDLSAAGVGDGQLDAVTVNGTNRADKIHVSAGHGAVDVSGLRATTHIAGSEPTDQLQINSLGGNDRVRVNDAARALIAVAVDLGIGQR